MRHEPCPDTWHPYPSMFARFIQEDPTLSAFFAYKRSDPRAWNERLDWLKGRSWPGRQELARALADHQMRLGAGGPSVRNARLIGEEGTVAVVSGQQVGLLTGPLYTIYKAVTVLQLARKAQEDLGVPVVPVFWAASDDHDFDEVNSVFVQDTEGEVRNLKLSWRPATADSLGYVPLPPDVRSLVGEMEALLRGRWEAREVSMRVLADAERSSTISEWFQRLMARLFRETGLVILDPCLMEIKRQMGPVLHQALLHSSSVTLELEAAEEGLRKRGFVPGLEPDRSQGHLFYRYRGHRLGLVWTEDEGLTDRGGRLEEPLSVKEVARLLRETPEDFSPNAALRPVCQEHLLPVLAHVSGPGEVAYLCQMREVFTLFDHQMPIIYPRLSATLVEEQQEDILIQKSLEAGDIPGALSERLIAEMRRLDELDMEPAFEDLRKTMASRYRRALEPILGLDPGLKHLSEQNLGLILSQVSYMEKKALQYRRRRHRDLVRSFRILGEAVMPRRRPQETVLNVFPFIARNGWDLPRRLGQLPLDQGHLVVYLGGRG